MKRENIAKSRKLLEQIELAEKRIADWNRAKTVTDSSLRVSENLDGSLTFWVWLHVPFNLLRIISVDALKRELEGLQSELDKLD